jgi:hypothetical protein
VELNVAEGANHRNSTLHYKIGKLPSFTLTFTGDLTAHCATRLTRNTTRQTSMLCLAHTNTVPTSTLPHISPVYVEVPQVMGNLNANNMHTLFGTVLRTSSTRIRNYTDSDGETGTGMFGKKGEYANL